MVEGLAVKLIMLVAFFAVMIFVGFYCRKHSTDVNGFVLGGRNVGPWLTAFAYGTSYFSAVIFVGYAGQFGWKFGIASTWIGIGNAVIGSLLAWVILGRRTRIMTQALQSATMPDYFSKRYFSPSLKVAAAIVIFIFMIPYTASLYNGLSRLFKMAFGLDYSVCVIVMAVLTAVYVIAGGYMATAINDFIQGIIMLFGIVAVIVAVLSLNGGLMGSMKGLAEINVTDPEIPKDAGNIKGIFSSFFGPDPLSLLGVVILTSLGTWGLPQMIGKFYAIKNEGSIHKGTIISTFFAIVVAGGCYFLGGFGRLFFENGAIKPEGGFDNVVPKMLESALKSPVLMAIVIILVLSASMSTLSSLVLTSSSTVTLDLLKGRVVKNMDEKKQLLVMRALIVVFILISAVLAIIQYNSPEQFIAQAMGISWGAMAGAFLAPFLYGLYWKRATAGGCWASMIFSSVFMIIDMLTNLKTSAGTQLLPWKLGFLQSPINAGAFCMIVGLILVPLVSLVTKAPAKADIDQLFTCYDRKITVRAKDSIEVSEE